MELKRSQEEDGEVPQIDACLKNGVGQNSLQSAMIFHFDFVKKTCDFVKYLWLFAIICVKSSEIFLNSDSE